MLYELLKNIGLTSSLKKSAVALGISYKTAFNYINKIEARLQKKIVLAEKGGVGAGGSTRLTEEGKKLILAYEKAHADIKKLRGGVS